MNADERYQTLSASMLGQDGVTIGTGSSSKRSFGADALCVNNKIFAMLVGGALVMKLPRQQVDALIAAGQGQRFANGAGRPMKEWIALRPDADLDWDGLGRAALAFVGAAT